MITIGYIGSAESTEVINPLQENVAISYHAFEAYTSMYWCVVTVSQTRVVLQPKTANDENNLFCVFEGTADEMQMIVAMANQQLQSA